ncbi:hypothetical protein [Cereibacter changlensis]|uniref:hypothetical protein n=1 Tax=Cereibacter changlensis TaxID=402884 RepID=UPI00200B1FCD|nr:hypothetical protein [Cereibacter changlensis]
MPRDAVPPWRYAGVRIAAERLDGGVFESLDWAALIARYDTPDALFYLDSPYVGGEAD